MKTYILVDKEPIPEPDLSAWNTWLETHKRWVRKTYLPNAHVSTVFLGVDYSMDSDGPPILFESLIFGGPHDGEGRRYATWEEAEAGHQALVKQLEK